MDGALSSFCVSIPAEMALGGLSNKRESSSNEKAPLGRGTTARGEKEENTQSYVWQQGEGATRAELPLVAYQRSFFIPHLQRFDKERKG